MATCQLISGLALPCKNFMPGVRRIFIGNFFSGSTNTGQNLTYTLNATNQITGATITTGKFYTFDLTKEAGEYVETINANAANGTTSYDSILNIYLSQYATNVRNQIYLLAVTKLLVIFEDRNGQYWLMGTDGSGTNTGTSNGVDMNASAALTGKAYASDANGYNLVFGSTEAIGPVEVLSTVIPSITA